MINRNRKEKQFKKKSVNIESLCDVSGDKNFFYFFVLAL